MSDSQHLKYLVTNPENVQWGMSIHSVGWQQIEPHSDYPPRLHPTRYLFNPSRGRVLNEFQLLFLTRGSGSFSCASCGPEKLFRVHEGDMFLLFPGEWHSYHPDEDCGWDEYWIGFTGSIVGNWFEMGFLDKRSPIFHVGLKEDMVNLYRDALRLATDQESHYQQALCGIVCHLLSHCLFYDSNAEFHANKVSDSINAARLFINDNIRDVTPESVADHLFMSYSKFRKMFKEYIGLAPGQYIAEVKVNMARELLTNTDRPIKEIAFSLGFENEEYFSTCFKRLTGFKPSAYRASHI